MFEITLIAIVLMHPVLGQARLWAAKTFQDSAPGSVSHAVASTVSVIS